MKLIYAPRSPFAIKVRIVFYELALTSRISLVETNPWTDETLRVENPLCKVPTLILPGGRALYDSPVICEYLNELAGGALFPVAGPRRWCAVRRQALADGLAEAVIRRFVEKLGPPNQRSSAVVLRQEAAIIAAIDAFEAEAALLARDAPTIGEIAAAAALSYLTFRSSEIAWRQGRSGLADWYDAFSARASMVATRIVAASQG
jgi:glutathione S-transferase